jgi:peroxygenase
MANRVSDNAFAAGRAAQAAREAQEEVAVGGKLSKLQAHLAYFDLNANGTLTFSEMRQSLKDMGLSEAKADFMAAVIGGGLGPFTTGNKLLSKHGLDVDVKKLKAHQHEGDTGVFDKDGNFSKPAFDAMFAKYDTDKDGAMSSTEIAAMQKDRAKTRGGMISTRLEFGALMKIGADGVDKQGNKTISKERLQSFYDGSFFYALAEEVKAKKEAAPKQEGGWKQNLPGWK